jgi:hypothetical protein
MNQLLAFCIPIISLAQERDSKKEVIDTEPK